ncbi:MAG: hypothetical protein HMLIMOIP_002707 [Candidatus Nitrosomirales archaeon]|jgi:hypothetical protein
MIIKKENLEERDPDEMVSVENLVISIDRFRRFKIRNELSHSGFQFKEYRSWWGSDFKILGDYKVGRLVRLFQWLDGNAEFVRSGVETTAPRGAKVVKPRY